MFARKLLAALSALLVTGCVTTDVEKPTVDPSLIEMHEARLMRVLARPNRVYCETLVVEVNPIFLNRFVLPAGQPRRGKGQDFEDRSWSIRDAVQARVLKKKNIEKPTRPRFTPSRSKLRLFIGRTEFVVDSKIRVRTLLKAPPTLTAHAAGRVILIIDGGKKPKKYETVQFVEGDLRGHQSP